MENGASVTLQREDHLNLLKLITDLKEQVARASKSRSSGSVEAMQSSDEALVPHLLEEEYMHE